MSYVEFFLSRPSNVARLELLEFSHPNFSKPYRVVRNSIKGVEVTIDIEGVPTLTRFDYYPVKIRRAGFDGSMENQLSISFGDAADVIPQEMDRILSSPDGFATAPEVRYWVFRSDDLAEPVFGPVKLEITQLPYSREGFSATAAPPSINRTTTGEIYTLERFPMLRGFL